MKLRKVMVSHMVGRQQEGTHHRKYELEPKGEAVFHEFGVNFEEIEGGPGNFSTAIVEWPDGHIEGVPLDCVRFIAAL